MAYFLSLPILAVGQEVKGNLSYGMQIENKKNLTGVITKLTTVSTPNSIIQFPYPVIVIVLGQLGPLQKVKKKKKFGPLSGSTFDTHPN